MLRRGNRIMEIYTGRFLMRIVTGKKMAENLTG